TQQTQASSSGRQLELLVESATGYAIFMVDADGCVSSWNTGAEHVLGWRKDQVIGQHSSIFALGPDARVQAMTQLDRARRNGSFSGEAWQRRADGSEFIAQISITRIVADDGTDLGFAKIIHD